MISFSLVRLSPRRVGSRGTRGWVGVTIKYTKIAINLLPRWFSLEDQPGIRCYLSWYMHVCLLVLNLIFCRARQTAKTTGDKQSTEMHLWGRHSTNWDPWDKQSTSLFPPGTNTDGFTTSLVPSHWNLSWNLILLKAEIFIDVVALAKGGFCANHIKTACTVTAGLWVRKINFRAGQGNKLNVVAVQPYACMHTTSDMVVL